MQSTNLPSTLCPVNRIVNNFVFFSYFYRGIIFVRYIIQENYIYTETVGRKNKNFYKSIDDNLVSDRIVNVIQMINGLNVYKGRFLILQYISFFYYVQ